MDHAPGPAGSRRGGRVAIYVIGILVVGAAGAGAVAPA